MVEGNWFYVLKSAYINHVEFEALIGINYQSEVDKLQIDTLV